MGGEVSSRIRRIFDVAGIAVFVAALMGVLFGTLVREQPPFEENRTRHPPPPLSAKRHAVQDFPQWFDLYLADRVGYRDVLLRWHQEAAFNGFGEWQAGKAWVGEGGWLYLNVADPDEFRDDRPTLDERLEAWADEFAARSAYLKGRGIPYVLLLCPEKSSVYPEHLPPARRRRPPPEPLAEMVEKLAARGVRAVNPLPALLEAKASAVKPLYFPEDSHWSDAGGRVGYTELAKELRGVVPGWEPLPDAEYVVEERPAVAELRPFAPTLPPRADTSEWWTARRKWEVTADPPFAAALPEYSLNRVMPPVVYTCEGAAGPPLVVFRDSFAEYMKPFFAADFRRAAVVLADNLEPAVLDDQKPAAVVQVMVARKLYMASPPARHYP